MPYLLNACITSRNILLKLGGGGGGGGKGVSSKKLTFTPEFKGSNFLLLFFSGGKQDFPGIFLPF